MRRKLILPVRTIREVMPLASCQPAWQKEVLRTRQLVMFLKKKKVEIRIEFRLARDKDQKDVMVSNISDAGGKSQENFSRFFPGVLQHQVLAYRLVFVHIQFNSFYHPPAKRFRRRQAPALVNLDFSNSRRLWLHIYRANIAINSNAL